MALLVLGAAVADGVAAAAREQRARGVALAAAPAAAHGNIVSSGGGSGGHGGRVARWGRQDRQELCGQACVISLALCGVNIQKRLRS